MKRLFKLLAISMVIVIMGVLFVGCSKDAKEEINFLNYGENIDEETVREFEKQYNIKVNIDPISISFLL